VLAIIIDKLIYGTLDTTTFSKEGGENL